MGEGGARLLAGETDVSEAKIGKDMKLCWRSWSEK